MARPGRPERNRGARSFRQLRRFRGGINTEKVFGTHSWAECKGKQNEPPVERYQPQARAFIERSGFALKASARMTGLVQDIDGKLHSLTALPEGLSVGGNLDLCGTNITALPEGLSVGGNLDLCGTNITALPEGLSVGGYLVLRLTKITALPDGLSVGGGLDLRDTNITALPEGLSVGGYLDLNRTKITALPKGLTVGGKISGGPLRGSVGAEAARTLRYLVVRYM
jgi:hypothetical protein